MDYETVKDYVIAQVIEVGGLCSVCELSDTFIQLDFCSLDMAALIYELEAHFSIMFCPEEVSHVSLDLSVGTLVDRVFQKVQFKQSHPEAASLDVPAPPLVVERTSAERS